ncbi:hypothetical protein KDL01_12970 [Actinospica durhamensis]|uniref:Rhamnogalacturonase A/B/Epimerase-like pectate lyase domain-containing protein n=1 Tax=Actinospica durhamensis TaxID=1508375 RepID=A0A941IMH6_9ACTN|nr:glycosyl hydrolase family 28-related protein [Actinospica durhamensis]MBR7834180.1 hypothetical protein [Actinospica durhamensis]
MVGAGGIAAAATIASVERASAAATGTAGWYDVTTYGAKGDGATNSGADDSAAIQAAMTDAATAGGGVVYFPPGTYRVLTPLQGASGVRLLGAHSSSSAILTNSASTPVLLMDGSFISGMEIGYLTLHASLDTYTADPTFTPAQTHLITGADLKALYLHDCQLRQDSPNHSIWFADYDATTGEDRRAKLLLECVFERNLEFAIGATRTNPAWALNAAAGGINVATWRDNVCWNGVVEPDGTVVADDTQYWYEVTASGANATNEANTWDNVTFEHPLGGMIHLQSATRTRIQMCMAWDSYNGIANSLISIERYSGTDPVKGTAVVGGVCTDTLIIGGPTAASDYPHAVAPAVPAYDISLDATTVHTTIVHPSKGALINLGGSTTPTIIGGSAYMKVYGTATTTAATALAGAGSPAGTPVATGSNDRSGLVTFGTGAAPTTGGLVQVTFGTPFAVAPTVMITPANGPTAGLLCAVESVSTTGFSLFAGSAPTANQANTHYGFYWQATS